MAQAAAQAPSATASSTATPRSPAARARRLRRRPLRRAGRSSSAVNGGYLLAVARPRPRRRPAAPRPVHRLRALPDRVPARAPPSIRTRRRPHRPHPVHRPGLPLPVRRGGQRGRAHPGPRLLRRPRRPARRRPHHAPSRPRSRRWSTASAPSDGPAAPIPGSSAITERLDLRLDPATAGLGRRRAVRQGRDARLVRPRRRP